MLKKGDVVKWHFYSNLYAIVEILSIDAGTYEEGIYEVRMLYNNYGTPNSVYHWRREADKIEQLTKKEKLELL